MVTIAGAGLAGLAAAVALARAGKEVTVLEKHDFVGRAVDDIQAIRNYEHDYDQVDYFRQQGLMIGHHQPIYRIVKYAPSGKSMTIETDNGKPLFYAFRRGPTPRSLEHQLYQQALELGVAVQFNTPVDLRANDAAIIATGGMYNNVWAYGSVYADAAVEKEAILFFMDNRYCPKGYIYAVPYGNELTIAATTFEIGCPIPQLFEQFINENPVMQEVLSGATLVKPTAGFEYANIPKTAVIGGKRIAGSAAGFLDPSRGFGISYALHSGLLAAQSIIENSDYDALWKAAFEKELLEGFKRRLLLEKMGNDDYEKFVMDGKISIRAYDKFPDFMKAELMKISFLFELGKYRRKYSLSRAFAQKAAPIAR